MDVLSLFGVFFETPFNGASQTYFVFAFTLCLRGCFVFLGNNFRIICCSLGTLCSCLHTSQEVFCVSVAVVNASFKCCWFCLLWMFSIFLQPCNHFKSFFWSYYICLFSIWLKWFLMSFVVTLLAFFYSDILLNTVKNMHCGPLSLCHMTVLFIYILWICLKVRFV